MKPAELSKAYGIQKHQDVIDATGKEQSVLWRWLNKGQSKLCRVVFTGVAVRAAMKISNNAVLETVRKIRKKDKLDKGK